MQTLFINSGLTLFLAVSGSAWADALQLTSNDIAHGEFMSKAQEFQGFGCSGENLSPQLSWNEAPEGTEAFAIQVYDPDAPTGSGWWHWQLVNIPKEVTELATGTGDLSKELLPTGSMNIKNDYGEPGFGGACPPVGHGTHRYQFTVHALSQKLDLPDDASGALTSYMVRANSLSSSTIEAIYKRD